jgi:FixJ family two-component response regulator
MDHKDSIVYVVDDDKRVREALEALLRSSNRRVRTFTTAAEYLTFARSDDAISCLILDIDMPEMSGLELQQELGAHDAPPIIFLTGYGDIPSTVKAMKAGASEFLTKPFDDLDMLEAVKRVPGKAGPNSPR